MGRGSSYTQLGSEGSPEPGNKGKNESSPPELINFPASPSSSSVPY